MSGITKTRSGRIIKKPDRYEPIEQVTDDFSDSDYDSSESDFSDVDSICTESTRFEDDVDEDGNLCGFVTDGSGSGSGSESEEEEEPPPPPVKPKRKYVRKKKVSEDEVCENT